MSKATELMIQSARCRMILTDLIYKAKAGHIGGSLSALDIMISLYMDVMHVDPKNPQMGDRDKFILSKGHSVEAYYSVLTTMGFFPIEELETSGKFGTRLLGHPTRKVPGVEMNTGALGHGLPVAVGMALAGKMDCKNYKVYVLMGDGEQAEGSIWEAAMAASNYKLDNLIGIVDRNRLQISGCTEDVMSLESLSEKWRSFGWEVMEADGHNMQELIDTFNQFNACGKPHLLIANTVKGKGISFMENVPQWHHGVLNEDQYNIAMRELAAELEEAKKK